MANEMSAELVWVSNTADDIAGQIATHEPKRRWSSRSRTGCLTCRKRRIKCDEETPVCRRCIIGGQTCRYGKLVPASDAEIAARRSREDSSSTSPPAQSVQRRVFIEAEPPDWEYLQAIRYYHTIAKPLLVAQYGDIPDPKFEPHDATHFVCNTLCSHLQSVCKARGRLLRMGEDPGLSTLWMNCARYLLKIITFINSCIESKSQEHSSMAFNYMFTLMCFDLHFDSQLWLAHVKGFLVYAEYIGGADAVINWLPKPSLPFCRFFSKVIMFNTTMPPERQFLQYSNYSDAEIKTILEFEFDEEIPCPMHIRLFIIHVTRLRHKIATADAPIPNLTETTHGLFHNLAKFDLQLWAKGDNPLGEEAAKDMGQLYHLAAWQYAILTLPQSATRSWAQKYELPVAETSEIDPYLVFRYSKRSMLVEKLRKIFPTLLYPVALKWPLLVAGVAIVDNATEDRDFIEQSLETLLSHPLSDGGVFLCLQRMRAFWDSGKTAWEDCFHEPVPAG
ncbi:hypothetical protein NLG97_g4854 [Lecanicillium saksenae]|uniref:Uncharacterized protein n=1 Tax=Lecanicillium saksenae TaxID=468837 RepID=A0ACC1QWM5_9HYPO|nr:hypothetical protein NLG97_g4854 [Lecanicillium saksenae]